MGLDLLAPPFFHSLGCFSVRIRTDSQALMEATCFEGARIFDAEPVNNAAISVTG